MLILLIHVHFYPHVHSHTAVDNINSSPSQEVRDQRAVRVEFNETLFDVNTVRVMFSSNCTSSVIIVDYSSPILITIPDTRANTGQCQYNIQVVDRATSTLPIGYPITGFFNARGDISLLLVFVSFY